MANNSAEIGVDAITSAVHSLTIEPSFAEKEILRLKTAIDNAGGLTLDVETTAILRTELTAHLETHLNPKFPDNVIDIDAVVTETIALITMPASGTECIERRLSALRTVFFEAGKMTGAKMAGFKDGFKAGIDANAEIIEKAVAIVSHSK